MVVRSGGARGPMMWAHEKYFFRKSLLHHEQRCSMESLFKGATLRLTMPKLSSWSTSWPTHGSVACGFSST